MSAIAVAVMEDGILVASDGVCYTYETGAVSGFVSKVSLLPEYNCFIGATGAGAFMNALLWEMNQEFGSFDDIVADFDALCATVHRKLFTDYSGVWETGPMTEVSCVIGGWSDARQAFEAYRIVSYDKESVSLSDGSSIRLTPFEKQLLPASIWCSTSPRNAMKEFGLDPAPPNDSTMDILSRLICACRADSGMVKDETGGGDDRFHMVGGFLQITVLQRDRIESVIAHRWEEDRLGYPIDPSGPGRFPAWLKERYEATLAEAF